jgi:hypothetical protein
VQSTQAKPVVPVIEPEAAEYAKKEGIEDVVQRLAEATARVYPAALAIRVLVRPDPELTDYWFVVFEVRTLSADLPDWREADHRWFLEYLQAYPYPRNHVLISRVIVEDE